MFVFDTTGSMGDELLYLQKEFEDIAGRVADQSTRFSVNFYRDHGDAYIVHSNPFSDDIKATCARNGVSILPISAVTWASESSSTLPC